MEHDFLKSIYLAYSNSSISRELSSQDDMFNKSPRGWDDYLLVGESAVRLIFQTLISSRMNKVGKVLDFGCGHGRVARHLRSMFPEAEIQFTDIDPSAYKFCARAFDGIGFQSDENISKIDLPGGVDLIFVGSVFTHLSWERCIILWKKLFGSLNHGGVLIATFRGPTTYRVMIQNEDKHNIGGYYDQLLSDYLQLGFGYQDYKGFENWGQNLFSVDKCLALTEEAENSRLIGYIEAGWANIHDAVSWSKWN